MYCWKCGRELPNGARFCNYCGTQQVMEQVPPPVSPSEQVFAYSEETIKRYKKNAWIRVLMMVLTYAALFAFLSQAVNEEAARIALTIMLGVVGIGTTLGLLLRSGMYKKLREIKLIIRRDTLTRVSPRTQENMVISRITGVRFQRDKMGKILTIRITSLDDTKTIAGFENMEGILGLISACLPDPSVVTEKIGMDTGSVGFQAVGSVLGIVLGLALAISYMNTGNYGTLGKLFAPILFIMALYFIIGSPFSKASGQRMRKYDILLSILCMIAAVLLLVTLLI